MSCTVITSRFATPGSLVIFLAVMTTLLPYNGATTSSVADVGVVCGDEWDACASGAVGRGCAADFDTDQYTECYMSAGDSFIESAYSCDHLSLTACCIDAASDNDCMTNEAFVEYYVCANSELSATVGGEECTAITCGFADGVDGAGTSGESGAVRVDSFHLRAALGSAPGASHPVAQSVQA